VLTNEQMLEQFRTFLEWELSYENLAFLEAAQAFRIRFKQVLPPRRDYASSVAPSASLSSRPLSISSSFSSTSLIQWLRARVSKGSSIRETPQIHVLIPDPLSSSSSSSSSLSGSSMGSSASTAWMPLSASQSQPLAPDEHHPLSSSPSSSSSSALSISSTPSRSSFDSNRRSVDSATSSHSERSGSISSSSSAAAIIDGEDEEQDEEDEAEQDPEVMSIPVTASEAQFLMIREFDSIFDTFLSNSSEWQVFAESFSC
jgi:hypothetical protein